MSNWQALCPKSSELELLLRQTQVLELTLVFPDIFNMDKNSFAGSFVSPIQLCRCPDNHFGMWYREFYIRTSLAHRDNVRNKLLNELGCIMADGGERRITKFTDL